MQRTLLKSKIHRATVTGADLNYEGSIAIDPSICETANLVEFEKVDIYNVNNGNRFSTYVIFGKVNEVSLNGAAARMVLPGDIVIIASYSSYNEEETATHHPVILLMDSDNSVKEVIMKRDNV